MPDKGPLAYIYDYLVESGPLTTWQEIKAWSELTGTHLEAWEAAMVWKISMAHIDQMHASRDPACPCPIEKPDPAAASNKVITTFRKIANER
jgi:hypothetical protein